MTPPPHGALAGCCRLECGPGGGGKATVYRAEDRWRGRRVALKVFRPELTESLQPPHILPPHNVGEIAGLARLEAGG